MKKLWVFCLTVLLVLFVWSLSGTVHAANGGSCGGHIRYLFDPNTKVLTLSGYGEMWDQKLSMLGANQFRTEVETVVVESGITYIGVLVYLPFVTSTRTANRLD